MDTSKIHPQPAQSRSLVRTAALSVTAAVAAIGVLIAVSGDHAASAPSGNRATPAQDKYTVRVPDGLAFSEFRGYEDWATIAVSQAGDLIEVIVGNPTIIKAFKAGIPGNGQPFPDGSKMAKIHWNKKQSTEAPDPTIVPDTLHDVDFMVKDSKRFSKTGGWAWAQFDYDNATSTFKPNGTGVDCGFTCHTIVAKKDYVFTAYGKR